jgi:hypothetical protein
MFKIITIQLFLGFLIVVSCTEKGDKINFHNDTFEGSFTLKSKKAVEEFGKLNIKHVTGSITIGNDSSMIELENLSALSSIYRIEQNLIIKNTNGISDLKELALLEYIGGYLQIENNKDLLNLDGLEQIQTLGEIPTSRPSRISDNPLLENIQGISGLQSIDYFELENNASLAEVALPNLVQATGVIVLKDLSSLATVDLSELNSAFGIECINLPQISQFELPALKPSDTYFYMEMKDLPQLSQLHSFPDLSRFELSIENTGISNLSGLSSIDHLYSLKLINNEKLESFEGLNHLYYTFHLVNNPLITSLDELKGKYSNQLSELRIANNLNLEGVNLSEIERISDFNMEGNPKLQTLDSYDSLHVHSLSLINTSFEFIPSVHGVEILIINDNQNLIGLDSIMGRIDGFYSISIQNNLRIKSLAGLDSLEFINYFGGTFIIAGNSSLSDFCSITEFAKEYDKKRKEYGTSLIEGSTLLIEGNEYNPTIEQIVAGDCSP